MNEVWGPFCREERSEFVVNCRRTVNLIIQQYDIFVVTWFDTICRDILECSKSLGSPSCVELLSRTKTRIVILVGENKRIIDL